MKPSMTANGIDYLQLAHAAFLMARPRAPFPGHDAEWDAISPQEQRQMIWFARAAVEEFLRLKEAAEARHTYPLVGENGPEALT